MIGCEYFDAEEVTERGQPTCQFPENKVSKIIGIVGIGTAAWDARDFALTKIDRRKRPENDLVFLPVDIVTVKRWKNRYGGEIFLPLPEGTDYKEYMYVIDRAEKASEVSFKYRKGEMDRVIENNPKKDIKVNF